MQSASVTGVLQLLGTHHQVLYKVVLLQLIKAFAELVKLTS
jgi:hypothetical protein